MSKEQMIGMFEKALILTASMRAALRNGVKHYDDKGNLLTTEKDILECLMSEGAVEIDETERVEIISLKEMMDQVRREWAEKIQ